MGPKTYLCLLLSLGTAFQVTVAGCPPEEGLTPCACTQDDDQVDFVMTCQEDYLPMTDLRERLDLLEKNATLAVVLDRLVLGTLPARLFEGLRIKRLELLHCELDSITEEGKPALIGLEDILEKLTIVASFTEDNIPTKLDFSYLHRLKELELSLNVITELGNDWFEKGPASLTHLVIANNAIETLGERAFANLPNLERLWMNGNRFGPVRRSMMPNPANKLKDLQFDNNALMSVPSDFLTGLPALTSLSLATNGLTRISQEIYKPLWNQLEIIDLLGNPIECDSHIDWMFGIKNPVIQGECQTPPERNGLDLDELIESQQQ